MIRLSELRHRFRAASDEDCDAVIKCWLAIPDGRPAAKGIQFYLKGNRCWIHEGDLRLPADTINDIDLIVTGDLIVDGWYDDSASGCLAVLGAMRCRHIFSDSGLFVGGPVLVQGLIYQYYNDWTFECAGPVEARAFISEDKACDFDSKRAVFEGYRSSHDGGTIDGYQDPFIMLGFPNPADYGDGETWEEDYDIEDDPSWKEITTRVKQADSEGRSPFVVPEAANPAIWRQALDPAASPARLAEIAASHPWDVAMRPQLAPELQDMLASHDDARARWAVASAPGVSEARLRHLSADPQPSVRAAVACHANCPADVLQSLAGDPAREVRICAQRG
jgi:hypothetical protein